MNDDVIYVDSSVLVEAVLDGGESGTRAREFLRKIESGACTAMTAAVTVDEVLWTVKRKDGLPAAVEAAKALKRHGALDVYACVTHPVLSGSARSRLMSSPLKELIVTNTIPLAPEKQHTKVKVVSVAGLLAEAIQRIHYAQSISSLFDGMPG